MIQAIYFPIECDEKETVINNYPMSHGMKTFHRDKTTINFQYTYHIAFWLQEHSTTLRAPNKCQIQKD